LWSMVEHSAWLERYPDGESQHCVPLQCTQKVCIHGLIIIIIIITNITLSQKMICAVLDV